jgi:nuclear pore complex protein Nup98-Nup96
LSAKCESAPNTPGIPIGFGTNNNTTTSPFGAAKPFGANAQPASGGLFGNNAANNTASGTGGFGFGGATNTSNVFGGGNAAPATGGGLFGSKPAFGAATTTAGATGGLFGTANTGTTGAFGNTANTGVGFGAGNAQAPLTGTANPPYVPFQEKEAQGATNHFQTIAFMPAYKNWSLEVFFLYIIILLSPGMISANEELLGTEIARLRPGPAIWH